MSAIAFSSSGYGVTASLPTLESAPALGIAIRVKGSTLKAKAASSTQSNLCQVGSTTSASNNKARIYVRSGTTASTARIVCVSNNSSHTETLDNIPLADLSDDAFYTIYWGRDTSLLSGSNGREMYLYDDATGLAIASVVGFAAAAGSNVTGSGLGAVAVSAATDGTGKSSQIVDGLAIYTRNIPRADRPIAAAPAADAAHLAFLWLFDEGTGSTATGAVSGATMNLTGQTWQSGGTWTAAAPVEATELRVVTQPVDTELTDTMPAVVVRTTDADGSDAADSGNVTVSLAATPIDVAEGLLLGTLTKPVVNNGGVYKATFDDLRVYPEGSDYTLAFTHDAGLAGVISDAFDITPPAGGGTTVLVLGDDSMKPMSAAGSAKERTVYFTAYDESGTPVTTLSGAAQISINGAAAVASTNSVAAAPGGGRYKLEVAAAELAAADDVVEVRPFGDATRIVGGSAYCTAYSPADPEALSEAEVTAAVEAAEVTATVDNAAVAAAVAAHADVQAIKTAATAAQTAAEGLRTDIPTARAAKLDQLDAAISDTVTLAEQLVREVAQGGAEVSRSSTELVRSVVDTEGNTLGQWTYTFNTAGRLINSTFTPA